MDFHRVNKEKGCSSTKPLSAIIFFGVDGAGKSTQANLLSSMYKMRGFKVKRCWLRARHSFSYLLSRILLLIGNPSTISQSGIKILDTRRLPEKKLWSFLEFISVLPIILYRMILPISMGYVVIADRFVLDTIVYNRFFIGEDFKIYEKMLMSMLPRNSLLIHMDVSRKELTKRRVDDWPINFIEFQLKEYRELVRARANLVMVSIDTSRKSVEETGRIISSLCGLLE